MQVGDLVTWCPTLPGDRLEVGLLVKRVVSASPHRHNQVFWEILWSSDEDLDLTPSDEIEVINENR